MANYKLVKRLSIFLKLKKYKKIGFRKVRNIVPRTLKYNGLKRQHFLSLDRDQSYLPVGDISNDGHVHPGHITYATKKKGGILSYLFTVICRFPRKYVYWLLGRSVFRRYYTMPLRLSMSRFVSSLVFRQYYGRTCSKYVRYLVRSNREELGKRAIMKVEQRLDSSILRLCRFKSMFTTKIPPRSIIRGAHRIKSPWSSLSSVQIRQLISHGNVRVNGNVCRFGGRSITSVTRIGMSFESKPSTIKLGNFSQVFYMIYRNMYLTPRLICNQGKPNESSATNVEKDVKLVFDIIGNQQSSYLLRPVLSLLRASSWNVARSAILSRHKMASKESKWNRRAQLQRLLRWKRLNTNYKKIQDQVVSISKQDPSLMYSRFSRCYASIVYGTRRCEWVQLQQRGGNGSKVSFCGRLYHKTNFLESELEYFQLIIRHYC